MGKELCRKVVALIALLKALFCISAIVEGARTPTSFKKQDGSEEWGYVSVRPKAHLFYWLYRSPYRIADPHKPWPVILWLQGGPGASGVGLGNFQEIGPLDVNLKPRNSTWLRVADLLFVDNPVGTGYSYVEEDDLVAKTDLETAQDLTALLIEIFNKNATLQKSPLYFVAESYGGRFAVTTALAALNAIKEGRLKLTLGGVALGNSWISPEDFVVSWGPLLKDVSRLDNNGEQRANSFAEKIKQELKDGKFEDATTTWSDLEGEISSSSNSVDFYNFLLDSSMDPLGASSVASAYDLSTEKLAFRRYSGRASILAGNDGGNIDSLMNGPIKNKLKIIPPNVTWGGQAGIVFSGLAGDFMKPRINEVDQLLAKGVQVNIYSGQVDLICATKGTEAWVGKLRWDGLKDYLNLSRTPLYCGNDGVTKGFTRSYKNFHFYWILGAGHFVPVEQPCLALSMAGTFTNSPAKP